ncbi:MAG: hypothetical protein CSA58_04580 [Micrococcales bacterium]|nr:MAG: hypothetical protein CSB46_00950 [Micrococcales bacterium]PIE27381.1 MAG: hypothetical protein CSA58_04580 [Micrococcales bacterium]
MKQTAIRAGSCDAPERDHQVHAAGAVCWRLHHGQLQVLLIHRPRYDDWSWPKGKLDPGEHYPVAAVREVWEETGLRIALGVRLPSARYRLSVSATKVVKYWAARIPADGTVELTRLEEVDDARWVEVTDADRMLTRRGDRAQLNAVAELNESGSLDTWPLLVVRHGHAHPRVGWGHEDAMRPLVRAGREQAADLAHLATAWRPARIFSSPWLRCQQTVEPLAETAGIQLKTKGKLSEDGHRHDAKATARLVAKQIERGRPVLICTHRPVLGTVLGALAGHAAAGVGNEIPFRDPFLTPGEVLVAHISRGSGRVVAVERHTTATLPVSGEEPAIVG